MSSAIAADRSLQAKQSAAIKRLLNLNHELPTEGTGPTAFTFDAANRDSFNDDDSGSLPTWKILILDRFAQDMISTLLKVNDLRDSGITVHMALTKERVPISDAPAVYFVQPTEENIQQIAQDISKNLYDLYYINFTRPVPRPLLEELATSVAQANRGHQVAQIYDQYLSFTCPEPHFFSLGLTQTFQSLNDPKASESLIGQLVNQIVDSLFTVLTTMNIVPVIRCPRGGAAEMVAHKLDSRLRENIANSRYSLFTETLGSGGPASAQPRSVLVLLDRNFDLPAMLSHAWTYQALIHDVLDLKLNRVTYTTQENNRPVRKSFDISTTDTFWAQNAAHHFPQVAVEIDEASNRFKKEAEEITRIGGVSSFEEINQVDMTANTKLLKSAISALPELTARKAVIDMHMNIATALLNVIKDRQLDVFVQMEENISKQNKAAILEAIQDKEKLGAEDKLRLFLIYYLETPAMGEEDIQTFEKALQEAGCDLAAFKYIEQFKSLSNVTTMAVNPTGTSTKPTNDFLGRFSAISNKLTDHLREGGGNLGSIISGVRNLLPSRRDLPVTKLVDTLMTGSGSERTPFGALSPVPGGGGGGSSASLTALAAADDYLYLDPKQVKRGALASAGGKLARPRTAFEHAVVFVIGGGNYIEYQNLQQFAQASVPPKTIDYGSTDIVSPGQFLQQLAHLAPLPRT
ncbi:Vesicle trafficking between the ER and Golgi [Tieghemiomyces parasiticus]|uniref:Vesicle trafficking between the ER and Golgi n=1 Tax=Tieghemiomyces parasiticus TaxID=78921 RepID=A0A9W8AA02_9FUNG|nr:Vesicle trafficking between the ER and Golgi [Tieghemiomyces parasiticus]